MGKLKQLVSQTAVYGLSSIIGRLLNYFLVPLYTHVFLPSEYGIVTEMYTYVTFLMILLTYGMETGFFRFSKIESDSDKVYSTALGSLFVSSFVFVFLGLLFSHNIADILGYSNHSYYVSMFVIILGIDAFVSIPFARLRQQNKAIKFAVYKLINIFTNIFLNLFFILWLPSLAEKISIFSAIYSSDFGVGYVFLSNLIASVVSLLLFVPNFCGIKFKFDSKLLKSMLIYSLPLVVSGLAGMINEFFDRISIKFFYTIPIGVTDANTFVMSELGIYGANTKIAILMTLFVQCFRYAADPFFFSQVGSKDFNKVFADVNKYLVAFGMFIFLGIMCYIDIVKYFIAPSYWEGLKVVPMLLLGHLLVGMVYLQSFWYKIKNLTQYGIVIFLIGSFITIILNYFLVPRFGYIACAFANLCCYSVMFLITFIWGKKYLPCNYDYKKILFYILFAFILYFCTFLISPLELHIKLALNTLLIIIYCGSVLKLEGGFKIFKQLKQKFLKK